jgi:hypothetical protein
MSSYNPQNKPINIYDFNSRLKSSKGDIMKFMLEQWLEEYCHSHNNFKYIKSRFRRSKTKNLQRYFLKGISEKYG